MFVLTEELFLESQQSDYMPEGKFTFIVKDVLPDKAKSRINVEAIVLDGACKGKAIKVSFMTNVKADNGATKKQMLQQLLSFYRGFMNLNDLIGKDFYSLKYDTFIGQTYTAIADKVKETVRQSDGRIFKNQWFTDIVYCCPATEEEKTKAGIVPVPF